jgi:hypothetical protein
LEWYIANITMHLENITTPWGRSALDYAYFFIIDEPGEEWYAQIIEIAKIIHNISPHLRIMETMNQNLETYPDEFLEEIDIYTQYIHEWVPSTAFPGDPEMKVNKWPARLDEFVSKYDGPREKELWVYLTHNRVPTPDTDIQMSGIMQRNSFWMYWIYGITGWLYWSFNWGTDMEHGYGYAGFGESNLIGYGADGRPLPSLRLERVRDGIEDFEYFWLLNYTCSYLEQNGYATEAIAGRALLRQVNQIFNQPEHLVNKLPAEGRSESYLWSYNPQPATYLALRHAVGQELARLNTLNVVPLLPY